MEISPFITYIVKCSDGTFYTGKTTNLTKRLRQHNGNIKGGAKYTRIRRPVALGYYEHHSSNKNACQREEELKQLSHAEKELLCTDFLAAFSQKNP